MKLGAGLASLGARCAVSPLGRDVCGVKVLVAKGPLAIASLCSTNAPPAPPRCHSRAVIRFPVFSLSSRRKRLGDLLRSL